MFAWPLSLVGCNDETVWLPHATRQHRKLLPSVLTPRFFARFQAWVGGFSNLMDEFRSFMAGRHAPFRLNGLRAIFVTPEDELGEEEDKVCCFFNPLALPFGSTSRKYPRLFTVFPRPRPEYVCVCFLSMKPAPRKHDGATGRERRG